MTTPRAAAVLVVSGALSIASTGCDAERSRDAGSPAALGGERLTAAPACGTDLPPGVAVGGRLLLRLMRGTGVTSDQLDALTSGVAPYFAGYGLDLAAEGPPLPVDIDTLVAGSWQEVEAALRAEGLDPGLTETDPRARRVVAERVFEPLGSFLRRHAHPARARVDVVVLRRIVEPASVVRRSLPHLAGLTVAPRPSASEGTGAVDPAWLGIEEPFTTTVLLSFADAQARPAGSLELSLAHEIGHALGLEHHADPDNLMSTGPHRCRPHLTASQVRVMRAHLPPPTR